MLYLTNPSDQHTTRSRSGKDVLVPGDFNRRMSFFARSAKQPDEDIDLTRTDYPLGFAARHAADGSTTRKRAGKGPRAFCTSILDVHRPGTGPKNESALKSPAHHTSPET